jgi:hypothetical protein
MRLEILDYLKNPVTSSGMYEYISKKSIGVPLKQFKEKDHKERNKSTYLLTYGAEPFLRSC